MGLIICLETISFFGEHDDKHFCPFFLKRSCLALCLVLVSAFTAHAMDIKKTGIVLVHGSWHQGASFTLVEELLSQKGYKVHAITLPGAGDMAAVPQSYIKRPLDPVAFGAEVSPNSGVTQDERTAALIAAIKSVNATTGGKALVIGHSLGGLTVTHAAEAMADDLSGVMYVSALMFPKGVAAGEFIGHSSMQNSKIGLLLRADPAVVGVLRIDPKSADAAYIDTARSVLAADVPSSLFAAALTDFTPDEPAQVLGVPSPASRAHFGTIPRYFVTLTDDKVIPPVSQKIMISRMDRAMKNKTTVFTLPSSHSPHLSQPHQLAALIDMAAQ